MKRTTLCLFAGIGATAKGQRDILDHDVYVVENHPVFARTLQHHFGVERTLVRDVKQMDFTRLGVPVQVVTGGPPCQPFSQAADNDGEYDPRDCIPDFVRAVRDLQPEVFLMEEVPTLTWARHRPYLERVLDDLKSAGYRVDHRVLDMSRYCVPQKRRRLFVVGVRLDLSRDVRWPHERPWAPTMAEALGWTPEEADRRAQRAPVYGEPSWVFERPSTTVVGSYRPEIQAAPGYRTKGDAPRQNTPGSVYITEAEALRLQGMPGGWYIAGNEGERRLQIGNACPPIMSALIVGVNLPAAGYE